MALAFPIRPSDKRLRTYAAVDFNRRSDRRRARPLSPRRLHEIGAKSVEADNLGHLLREVLETVIGVTHADFGTIQLVDRSSKRLRIVTARGLPEAFVSFFDTTDNAGEACGAALERGTRIVVEDVRMASEYSEASRRVMLDSGILACQSTPLLSRGGGMLGIISTHFRSPHRSTEKELQFVDLWRDMPRTSSIRPAPARTGRDCRPRANRARTCRCREPVQG